MTRGAFSGVTGRTVRVPSLSTAIAVAFDLLIYEKAVVDGGVYRGIVLSEVLALVDERELGVVDGPEGILACDSSVKNVLCGKGVVSKISHKKKSPVK